MKRRGDGENRNFGADPHGQRNAVLDSVAGELPSEGWYNIFPPMERLCAFAGRALTPNDESIQPGRSATSVELLNGD